MDGNARSVKLGENMTDRIIIEDSESNTAEKTVMVSGNKIKILSDMFEKTYTQTYRDTLREDVIEGDYQSSGVTEFEIKQYREKVRNEEDKKYKIQGELASGGMGAILRVIDQDLQRPMAMKVIKPAFKNDEDTLKDFIREAKITGLLEHPNIIPVHELGLSEETGLFFTMKLARGETLNRILTEIKKGTPQYVEKYNMFYLLSIFRRICDAISFAHSKGIIHQDIKPHNVIVGQHGEVLVMDWGLARFIGDPEEEQDAFRREILRSISVFSSEKKKVIRGSPAYMAPEQVKGDSSLLDRQTDIFLLGTTLYHIFTLEPPYRGDKIKDVLSKAEHWELIPPQDRNPDRMIPEEICRIIMKAAAWKKEDRYQIVQELIDDVDDVIAGKWIKQEKKTFASGQFLMRQGESAEEAYLITRGRVEVFKETGDFKVTLSTLSQGDIVGEMALITDDKRSASVKALENTEVTVLTKQLLAQNLRKLPPYIEKMVATITNRLRTADTFIHPHLTTDCSPYVLRQLCLILRNESAKRGRFIILLKKVGAKIADDLGIPVDKVEKVFLNAAEANLLTINGNKIIVEDVDKVLRSASLAKALINK
jgi:serine/threonine protein kinase